METDLKILRTQVVAWWGLVTTVLTFRKEGKALGEYLVEAVRKDKYLGSFLRACYDTTREYGFKSGEPCSNAILKQVKHPLEILKEAAGNPTHCRTAAAAWRALENKLGQPEQIEAIRLLLDHKPLGILTHGFVNKVFRKAGFKEMPPQPDPPELVLEFGSASPKEIKHRCATAVLYYGRKRVANLVIELADHTPPAMAALRKAGVKIVTPQYVDAGC